ncbi:FAD-dependent monooxygenase [Dactylosporangium aurantiacum]|uniref:FAD-dependent monooxygenase n=1 Tax=Dactylosporangium aurantiacum TaxID=35754 RepID=A0A9Q9IC67_9ACTN|nr:FAD-dependent monooxygenase [Dactylosporangium aurantiacum]MDG6105189.1 FAD-dependent monooxygenase [Dactylosporangium aurantiacum]UWZ51710.1 FAD-dependent monooxygenase [Dactylosporangium aurantiacum]
MSRATTSAVVLGASIAGLLAARALSETFDTVTVLDRDDLTGSGARKGVPQGRHAHMLFARGREILEELFPGLTDELVAAGALTVDIHAGFAWHNGPAPMARAASDLVVLAVSRPALEDYLRARVGKLPNVRLRGGLEATGLLHEAGTVTGARVVPLGPGGATEALPADLVVDATGRGNRGPTWLAELGYAPPEQDSVMAGVVYATREYERAPLPGGTLGVLTGVTPRYPFGAALLPMEGDRWILTLAGLGDDVPPTDEEGFAAYATRLPIADLAEVVHRSRPLTPPRPFRVPASVRRRYERIGRHPEGFVAFGDAICAFNPIYGQGMTVAALEALELRAALRDGLAGLPRRFYARASTVIDTPWDMAVGGDLAFPSVPGRRTAKVRFFNWYIARLLRAAETSPEVAVAFHRVVNLTAPPQTLFAPAVLRRVLSA